MNASRTALRRRPLTSAHGSRSGGELPRQPCDDAVTLLTYHRAKGLEWPLVILADLEREPGDDPFGLHVMSDRAAKDIDWRAPLADRWLRLWPWRWGRRRRASCSTRRRWIRRKGAKPRGSSARSARVLYVGATRARDYLVLALPPPGKKAGRGSRNCRRSRFPISALRRCGSTASPTRRHSDARASRPRAGRQRLHSYVGRLLRR